MPSYPGVPVRGQLSKDLFSREVPVMNGFKHPARNTRQRKHMHVYKRGAS